MAAAQAVQVAQAVQAIIAVPTTPRARAHAQLTIEPIARPLFDDTTLLQPPSPEFERTLAEQRLSALALRNELTAVLPGLAEHLMSGATPPALLAATAAAGTGATASSGRGLGALSSVGGLTLPRVPTATSSLASVSENATPAPASGSAAPASAGVGTGALSVPPNLGKSSTMPMPAKPDSGKRKSGKAKDGKPAPIDAARRPHGGSLGSKTPPSPGTPVSPSGNAPPAPPPEEDMSVETADADDVPAAGRKRTVASVQAPHTPQKPATFTFGQTGTGASPASGGTTPTAAAAAAASGSGHNKAASLFAPVPTAGLSPGESGLMGAVSVGASHAMMKALSDKEKEKKAKNAKKSDAPSASATSNGGVPPPPANDESPAAPAAAAPRESVPIAVALRRYHAMLDTYAPQETMSLPLDNQIRHIIGTVGSVLALRTDLEKQLRGVLDAPIALLAQIQSAEREIASYYSQRAADAELVRHTLSAKASTPAGNPARLDVSRAALEAQRLKATAAFRIAWASKEYSTLQPLCATLRAYANYFAAGHRLLGDSLPKLGLLDAQLNQAKRIIETHHSLTHRQTVTADAQLRAAQDKRMAMGDDTAPAPALVVDSKQNKPAAATHARTNSSGARREYSGYMFTPAPAFAPVWCELRGGHLLVHTAPAPPPVPPPFVPPSQPAASTSSGQAPAPAAAAPTKTAEAPQKPVSIPIAGATVKHNTDLDLNFVITIVTAGSTSPVAAASSTAAATPASGSSTHHFQAPSDIQFNEWMEILKDVATPPKAKPAVMPTPTKSASTTPSSGGGDTKVHREPTITAVSSSAIGAASATTSSLSGLPAAQIVLTRDEESHPVLRVVRPVDGNDVCSDCGAARPEFAVTNLGILVCPDCAEVMSEFGPAVSRVHSCAAYKLFDDSLLRLMQSLGNHKVNEILEGGAGLRERERGAKPRPNSTPAAKEAFLKKKYVQRGFVKDKKLPDPEMAPFHALQAGDIPDLLKSILYGADLKWKNPKLENRTALHQAVAVCNTVAAELLLQCGAPSNTVDAKRSSPLHLAASVGHPRLVTLLLAYGADEMLVERDGEGHTPLEIAKRGTNEEIETLLETAEISFLRKQLARPSTTTF